MNNLLLGRCSIEKDSYIFPNKEGFCTIFVTEDGEYKSLHPSNLKDSEGNILESFEYYSKIDDKSPYLKSEKDNQLYDFYYNFKNQNSKSKIVSTAHKHGKTLFYSNGKEKLSTSEFRKIMLKKYIECIKDLSDFKLLKNRLQSSEKLLLLDINGPNSLDSNYFEQNYYMKSMKQEDILIPTYKNLDVFLNDNQKNCSHIIYLAILLQDMDVSFFFQ